MKLTAIGERFVDRLKVRFYFAGLTLALFFRGVRGAPELNLDVKSLFRVQLEM